MSNSPNRFDEKLTNSLIKLLIAGSGGSALLFLYLDDVEKAVISGFVALGGGLITSFGEGLMSTLKGSFKRRGQAVGQLTDEAIDRGIDKAVKRLTRFDRQYREAIKTSCYDLEIEGFRGDLPPLAIEDVFVPLRLDLDPGKQLSKSLVQEIWELLPKSNQSTQEHPHRRLAIIAAPGYGKTTLMRYLSFKYANGSFVEHGVLELLPIFLVLRTIYSKIQDQQTPSLPNLIVEQLKSLPSFQDLTPSLFWFKEQLRTGKCLLILDGLDEVPDSSRELVSRWIDWQIQAYPCQFIVTSRPHGYDSSLFHGMKKLGILDFTNEQKQHFLSKWYKVTLWRQKWEILWQESTRKKENQQLSQDYAIAQSDQEALASAEDLMSQFIRIPQLNSLARNPLLITIIAATHRAFDYLPEKRVKLYQKMFNLLLEDRPKKKIPLTIRTAEENQIILQDIALFLMSRNEFEFTVEQADRFFQSESREYLAEYGLSPVQFLREIQVITGLLSGGESNLYQFTHKTFQEYLAAAAIKQRGKTQFLINRIRNKNWQDWEEVICFSAAMGDANKFIKSILESYNHPSELLLAWRIKTEMQNKIDANLKDKLNQALAKDNLEGGIDAKVLLEQHFQNLSLLNETTAISHCITQREYQLFIRDQVTGQFHSKARWDDNVPVEYLDKPVTNLTLKDAWWFCAWLSTQENIAPESGTYDYQLSNNYIDGSPIQVRRVKVHDRYANLINYLANGHWKEADQETFELVLDIAGRKEEGWLRRRSIWKMPAEDLRFIDWLWVKFSGGQFGFRVQQEIYLSCGNFLDGAMRKEEFAKFCEVVGWASEDAVYSLETPLGHLPFRIFQRRSVPICLFSTFAFSYISGLGLEHVTCASSIYTQ